MLDGPRVLWRGGAGARGLVKHAYHVAAEVTGYTVTIDPATRRLTLAGAIATSNPIWLTQAGLVFVIPTTRASIRGIRPPSGRA